MSRKLALIIGNTEYTDPGLAQLATPHKDAEDFSRVLKDPDICGFDKVSILLNQPSSSVVEVIDEFFDLKKPDDLLILYFSGHGVRDELGSLYLAFKNTIRSRLRSTAIKSSYIREAMDQSRSKRQVVILDCCNSGAFPEGVKAEVGDLMGMTRAFQGYGRFVLTACDATQYAWDGDKIIGETANSNSLFTYFLVKGLEGEADEDGDGKITVDELYDYVYEEISKVTPKQTPTKSASKQTGEIVLRQITRIEDAKPVPLPIPLVDSMENPFVDIRLGAVQQLTRLLNGKNLGLALSARGALERIAEEDDSRTVSRAAMQAIELLSQPEQLAKPKIEEEHLVAEKLKDEPKSREETVCSLSEPMAKESRSQKATMEVVPFSEEKRIAAEATEVELLVAQRDTEEERVAPVRTESERNPKEETLHLTAREAEEELLAREIAKARNIFKLERPTSGLETLVRNPSYWKALGLHLVFGLGLFYVNNSLRRKWLYPLLALYSIFDFILLFFFFRFFIYFEDINPLAKIFGLRIGIVTLGLYIMSFLDVIWICRTQRHGIT